MGERDDGKRAGRGGAPRVLRGMGNVAGQVLLFLISLLLVLYFSPSVQGLQIPLLALALEDRPVHLVFDGGVASPLHGRIGVARPALLDEEDREILRAELIEIDGAGWRGGGPAARSVLLKRPEVNVFLCPDGSLSLMTLVKEKKRRKRQPEKGSWRVESLRIEDGNITVDLPLVTGRIGPVDLSGKVGEFAGVSRGEIELRIGQISLELRGPSFLVDLLSALGWSPERLRDLGPVEVRASWDGNSLEVTDLSLAAMPMELHFDAAVDLDALILKSRGGGEWAGQEFFTLDLGISPDAVGVSVTLDPPDIAALPPVDGVSLRGLGFAPVILEAGGREVSLRLGRVSLDVADRGDAQLGEISLEGALTIRLAEGDLAAAWSAVWEDASAPELITRFKPTLNLALETRLGAVTQGELALSPELRVTVDAGFTPPMTLELRALRLDSAFGQVLLRGRLGPRPPLGLPGYQGTLQLVGIDLDAIKANVTVSPVLERFLSGHLEGEAVFEGSPMDPTRLSLARCAFGIVGGASPLGVHCPEGGTVVDPTRAPEVGPMTMFKGEIPWGEGKLLLGPPREAATP